MGCSFGKIGCVILFFFCSESNRFCFEIIFMVFMLIFLIQRLSTTTRQVNVCVYGYLIQMQLNFVDKIPPKKLQKEEEDEFF
jgi:hypothetical protein